MPRKDRIEYEHAFYHVMNRGRGRRTIFHNDSYYKAFIEVIESACERFNGVVHAYCLMGNHYHLLIETPNANLGRIMRHINGIYTQRYNRMKRTDGPLFRGRYKAILVDADSYLLQLSRYIHRNPIDTRNPLVQKLVDYRWSSYPAYINTAKPEAFLEREQTYKMLGHKQRYSAYANFVDEGVDEQLKQYYSRGNIATVLGDKDFKAWLHEEIMPEDDAERKARKTHDTTSMHDITKAVANAYQTSVSVLRKKVKGPQPENEGRKVAMYLSQEISGETLQSIADYFNLSHRGSVSFATHQIRSRLKNEHPLRTRVDKIIRVI